MAKQLTIFDVIEEVEKQQDTYWKQFFNWEPAAGKLARLDIVVGWCETLQRNLYCNSMQVKILKIENDVAVCETTKEWEEACGYSNITGGVNNYGNIWHIPVKNLAPIQE